MRNYKAKDVDSYIASSAQEARKTLKELRRAIRSAVPKAEEKISWGIPFYRHHGLLAGFAVFKRHAGFGFAFPISTKHKRTLEKKGYKTGRKTIQIRFDQEVPASAIKKILREKVKINMMAK